MFLSLLGLWKEILFEAGESILKGRDELYSNLGLNTNEAVFF